MNFLHEVESEDETYSSLVIFTNGARKFYWHRSVCFSSPRIISFGDCIANDWAWDKGVFKLSKYAIARQVVSLLSTFPSNDVFPVSCFLSPSKSVKEFIVDFVGVYKFNSLFKE